MIIISLTTQDDAPAQKDLLSVQTDDLSLCPETAGEADFLQMMDGWL